MPTVIRRHKKIWTVGNAFSREECMHCIAECKKAVWTRTGTSDTGRKTRSTAGARLPMGPLFGRIEASLPRRAGWPPAGIAEERMIYASYEPGDDFPLHDDAPYHRPDGSRSEYTIIVYLNDDFSGGETVFPDQGVVATPKAGSALIFEHGVRNLGKTIESGRKYILHCFAVYRAAG